MTKISRSMMVAAATCTLALPAFVQSPGYAQQASPPGQQAVPAWVQRGIPSAGHAALTPLVGSWRVQQSVYGTMGRSPDLPPIVSEDILHHSGLGRGRAVHRGHDRGDRGGTAVLAPGLAWIQQHRPPL
jgi:hypothetical protein